MPAWWTTTADTASPRMPSSPLMRCALSLAGARDFSRAASAFAVGTSICRVESWTTKRFEPNTAGSATFHTCATERAATRRTDDRAACAW